MSKFQSSEWHAQKSKPFPGLHETKYTKVLVIEIRYPDTKACTMNFARFLVVKNLLAGSQYRTFSRKIYMKTNATGSIVDQHLFEQYVEEFLNENPLDEKPISVLFNIVRLS